MASNNCDNKAGGDGVIRTTANSGENHENHSYQDLTQFMQTFLQRMEEQFHAASDQILGKIDLMSQRIDELEKNIAELSTQAAMDEKPQHPPSNA